MPRPRRTMFRMRVSGLPETSWQVSSPQPISFGFSSLISALFSFLSDLQPMDFPIFLSRNSIHMDASNILHLSLES